MQHYPPHMDALSQTISDAFLPAGRVWETIANNTGLRIGLMSDHPELFWYRPAGFQIFEFLCFFPLYRFLWTNYAQHYISRNVTHATPQKKPMYMMDRILGIILAACFLLQVYIKVTRPNGIVHLFWMLMPCHVITFCWAFVLLQPPESKNYALCRFIGAMMAMSSWGAVAATAFPDFSDQRFFFERVVFMIHHVIMLVVPHYWVAVHGLPPLTKELFLTYCCGCIFHNYGTYTIISYLVGVSINYNVYPHLQLAKALPFPMGSVWYRFFVPIGLFVWGFVYYVLLHGLNRLYFSVVSGTSPPVSVSQERELKQHQNGHHHHRSLLSRSSSSSHSSVSSSSPPPTEPSASPSHKNSAKHSLRGDDGDDDDRGKMKAAPKRTAKRKK